MADFERQKSTCSFTARSLVSARNVPHIGHITSATANSLATPALTGEANPPGGSADTDCGAGSGSGEGSGLDAKKFRCVSGSISRSYLTVEGPTEGSSSSSTTVGVSCRRLFFAEPSSSEALPAWRNRLIPLLLSGARKSFSFVTRSPSKRSRSGPSARTSSVPIARRSSRVRTQRSRLFARVNTWNVSSLYLSVTVRPAQPPRSMSPASSSTTSPSLRMIPSRSAIRLNVRSAPIERRVSRVPAVTVVEPSPRWMERSHGRETTLREESRERSAR
jgi:hypothetical protein